MTARRVMLLAACTICAASVTPAVTPAIHRTTTLDRSLRLRGGAALRAVSAARLFYGCAGASTEGDARAIDLSAVPLPRLPVALGQRLLVYVSFGKVGSTTMRHKLDLGVYLKLLRWRKLHEILAPDVALYRDAQRLWQTYKDAFGGGNATVPEGAAGRRAGRRSERRAAQQMLRQRRRVVGEG